MKPILEMHGNEIPCPFCMSQHTCASNLEEVEDEEAGGYIWVELYHCQQCGEIFARQ